MRTCAKRVLRLGVPCLGLAFFAGSFRGDATPTIALLAQTACPAPADANAIVKENCKVGNPPSDWDLVQEANLGGDPSIQGFATDISVNNTQTVHFKISSTDNYRIQIYRLGYYGGAGARRVATLLDSSALIQTACNSDASTGLVDCGNWSETASWDVAGSTSGIYVAKLNRFSPVQSSIAGLTSAGTIATVTTPVAHGLSSGQRVVISGATPPEYNGIYTITADAINPNVFSYVFAGGASPAEAGAATIRRISGASHIVFVVRDDSSTSDLVVKTSDTTWQAYNSYGVGGPGTGSSFYVGQAPAFRGYKLSYNRPFDTRGNQNARSFVFSTEYPLVRWLEANGYDASYISSVDLARGVGTPAANPILNHKVFISSGHDEYWSGAERSAVETARGLGKHLAFFSGNLMYWKTRWENNNRTLVSYKETWANAKIDPTPEWTGTWRDPRFSPPADGGRPENAVTGQLWTVNCCTTDATFRVPAADGKMRFWRHTSIATLQPAQTATLPFGTLGYEWDEDLDNGFRPAGLVHMSTTTANVSERIADYGNVFPPGVSTHHLTLYRYNSALVFAAGTVQWAWGLDDSHDGSSNAVDQRMQQATVNILADMRAQPHTLQAGLSGGNDPSLDTTAPVSTVTSPSASFSAVSGTPVTITGTAIDTGGGVVGGVEVSVDAGATWHPADGRENWSYTWIPNQAGPTIIKSRAVDDSGNLEVVLATDPSGPATGPNSVSGAVTPATLAGCPCSIWSLSATPVIAAQSDTSDVEVGVKFHADTNGFITALRFYKGLGNTAAGGHIGHLWNATGTLLASVTFTSETASGWQQATLSSPVAIVKDAIYVASYHAPGGKYAYDPEYFDQTGHDNGLLHAPRSVAGAGNGVFRYGGIAFPDRSFNAANYWVDVVLTGNLTPDTTPPVITDVGATPIDATTANIHWSTDELSNSQVSYGVSPTALSSVINLPQSVTLHSVTLTGLQLDTTYYYRVTSADGAPVPNSSTAPTGAPASFALSSASLVDTTVADFSAGVRDANAYIGQTGDGDLMLKPTEGQEFSGSTLPAGWSSTVLTTGGSASVIGGQLVLDGARASTNATYGSGRSLEFVATFGGQGFENVGFATTFDNAPWAMFTTYQGGALYARTLGTEVPPTLIVGNYIGTPHLYRIDWNTSNVVFSIDGATVAVHDLAIGASISPGASDFAFGGGSVSVDWVRMSPYAAASTFLSRIFDGGADTEWGGLSWTGKTPAGTSLAMSVRIGNTPVPDATWTSFAPVTTSGTTIGGHSRYVQYRTDLATTDSFRTPVLSAVIIGRAAVGSNVTPPVISNVSATSTSFATTSRAIVTWETNVFANAVVRYGTSPSALNSTGSDPAMGLLHSVTLNGLLPNTTYYYTVSSADGLGNSATAPVGAPAVFTTPPARPSTFIDTTVADFSAGTPGSTTIVVQAANGEVAPRPATDAQFDGTSVPADWVTATWNTGGAATVGSGLLTVDAARITSNTSFGSGRSIEFRATFGADSFQAIGFVGTPDFGAPWAVFGTGGSTNTIFARTTQAGVSDEIAVGSVDNLPHRYRIDWNATSVVYWVDGAAVVTKTGVNLGTNLFAIVSDFNIGTSLSVDWLQTYQRTGTFLSRVFDAGTSTDWGTLSWTSPVVTGTTIRLSVRTGETPVPDTAWTSFTPIASSGGSIGLRSRYIQYQALLSSPDALVSPRLEDVTILIAAAVNTAPIANDDSYSTNEDAPLTVPAPGVIGNDTDANSDPLTAILVLNPAHGTVTLSSNGSFTYTPDRDYHGLDSFAYKANDGSLDSNAATVRLTIAAVNDAPVATPQTVSTNEDVGTTVTLSGNDVDSASLTMSVGTGPSHGTLGAVSAPTCMPLGAGSSCTATVMYTPNGNFNGSDSFSFTVSDGTLTSAAAVVNLTVLPVNDAPTVITPGAQTGTEGQAVTPLSISATDVDGDTLTYSATGLPSGLSINTTTGVISGTVGFNATATNNVIVTVNDGNGGTISTAAFSWTITLVNRPPTAAAMSVTTAEDTAKPIVLSGTDPDGDTLTFSIATQPAHGTLTGTPPNITYTPALNYNGDDSFTFKVNDGALDSTVAAVSITVTAVNDPPTISSIVNQTTPQNIVLGPVSFTVGDVETAAGSLTLTGGSSNTMLVPIGNIVFGGSGANRTVTVTPAAGQTGMATISITVTDSNGGTANDAFVLTVTPPSQAPTTTTTPTSSLNPSVYGQLVTFTTTVVGAGGPPAGTVTFYDNGVALGTTSLSGGTASLATAAVHAGTRSITATYSGTSSFAGSTSGALIQTVSQAAAGTTALAITPLSVQYSDKPTFTATYTPSATGAPVPKTMSFKIGTEIVGEAPIQLVGSQYQATWSQQLLESSPTGSTVKPGGKTVVATTADANFVASSASRPMTVNKEDARVTYTGPTAPSLGGQTGSVVLTATVKDITMVAGDAAWDGFAGDISKAQVMFIDRGTNITLGTVNVVPGTDPKIGTATLSWSVDLGTATSKVYSIGFVVTNYYNRNNPLDNASITVSK